MYEYAQLEKKDNDFYLYTFKEYMEEEYISRFLLSSLNILGSRGWKVVSINNKFIPSGFSVSSELNYVLLEREEIIIKRSK